MLQHKHSSSAPSLPCCLVHDVKSSNPAPPRRCSPAAAAAFLPAAPCILPRLHSKPAAFALLFSLLLLLLLHHQTLLQRPPSHAPPSPPLSSAAPSLAFSTTLSAARSPQQQRTPSPPVDARGDEARVFVPHGSGAALFVLYGAYRGGAATFAVVGLGSKPLYVYGDPQFECYWQPAASPASSQRAAPIKSSRAYAMQPDFGYGRVYTVVVVNCTFEQDVGTRAGERGGQLVLYATHGDGLGKPAERIAALTEDEHSYDPSRYQAPYPYEFLYCGSPLFSDLNAQRIREWIAYHVKLFGPKSHFVFHDAGGMHDDVRAALEPWKRKGYITIENITQTAQYDGYYYNQFLIVNDCLHRTRFMANWTFFFDVDEFIYIGPETSLCAILGWHANNTMVHFKQLRMSDTACQFEEPEDDSRWIFEKLVYGEEFHDLKYAVQARQVFATGVHLSQKELGHMQGDIGWAWWPHMHFYHYHDTIAKHGKLCQNITNNSSTFETNGHKYSLDTSMVSLAAAVKTFEFEQVGDLSSTQNFRTRA